MCCFLHSFIQHIILIDFYSFGDKNSPNIQLNDFPNEEVEFMSVLFKYLGLTAYLCDPTINDLFLFTAVCKLSSDTKKLQVD